MKSRRPIGGLGAVVAIVATPLALACSGPPPASQFPTGTAALERMHETYECSNGVSGEAKVDYFGDGSRRVADMAYLAMLPSKLRFEVYTKIGASLIILTTDGERYAYYDKPEKLFLYGPAETCNVARFTGVPVPPHALAQLLRGEAPVLVHEPPQLGIVWEGDRYVVTVPSKHQAVQEIHLVPLQADWNKPWSEQRVQVLEVSVEQEGMLLYRAELTDHRMASTAEPRVDPDGLAEPISPSGPACSAPVPGRLRFLDGGGERDLMLRIQDAAHNPPIVAGAFQQQPPTGFRKRFTTCQ